jgi:hypothetical protein
MRGASLGHERRMEAEKFVAGIAQAGLRVFGSSMLVSHSEAVGRAFWVPVRTMSGNKVRLLVVPGLNVAVAAIAGLPEILTGDIDTLDAASVSMMLMKEDEEDILTA